MAKVIYIYRNKKGRSRKIFSSTHVKLLVEGGRVD